MQELAREAHGVPCPDDGDALEERKIAKVERTPAEILLAMTDLIVSGRELPELFERLTPLLRQLTNGEMVEFAVCSVPKQSCAVTCFWGREAVKRTWEWRKETEQTAHRWVWEHQEVLWIPNVEGEERFGESLKEMRERGIRSYTIVPLSSQRRRYGTLGIGGNEQEAEKPERQQWLERAARLVALAVENHEIHEQWQKQQDRLQSLVEIGREVASTLDFDQLLELVFVKLQEITNCEFMGVTLLEADMRTLRVRRFLARESAGNDWVRLPLAHTISAQVIESRSMQFLDALRMDNFDNLEIRELKEWGIQSLCCAPLLLGTRALGSLMLGSAGESALSQEDGEYLRQVATQIAPAIHNATAFEEAAQAKDRLTQEKRYLESEVREQQTEKIVGNSPLLKRVLDNAATVANTDATVLITGETGTGKERVALAIHLMSSRRDRNFIKLNCAAIPTGLLESELFGHERGAFTGAVSQKVGRLELADRGTLLLDEIGEIPLELQPKLLRVLQDQEFERLGGTKTIKVDARIVAASNRDLARAVEEKEFRSDLFYRLNVFPLQLPSLRERREDIPLLIRYFVGKCAARMHKRITLIPDEAVEVMMNWRWPGNVRELENFIERSVILTDGERLRAPLAELREEIEKSPQAADQTLREREREHILDVLRQTHGVISGEQGAAARLGLKRTTLQHKMQRLGISREDYLD
jgi:formate hydrogenlyase transcriptional activator